MKHAIWIGMMSLALGACGSNKQTCEKVMKRAVECQAQKMGADTLDGSGKKAMDDIADGMITEVCKNDDLAGEAKQLETCTSKSDCDEVNACVEKLGGGAFGL